MNKIIGQEAWSVLVVDDDEMLNYLFCTYLSSKNFETISVSSVADAKKILQTTPNVDLILLDYQLGDGVGMDVLSPEAINTYLKLPPVIMISANEEPEFLEQCFAGGVNDYIIKPVNLSLLTLKVEALIKSVSMQRLISVQNEKLEQFKQDAEREEQVAKFTYEYLLRQNSSNYLGFSTWLQSSAAFSGDMTLVRKSPSGHLYFVLADATGHGLSAAITIMPVVTIFNSMVSKGFHLQQIVAEINRKLVSDTPGDRFVAAIFIEINPYRKELHVWNGGMPSAQWVYQGQALQEYPSQHMALGIMDDSLFDASVMTHDLPDAGFIFAYSDGLTEEENDQGEQFSFARVQDTIAQQPEDLLAALATRLTAFAQRNEYKDDVSACIIVPSIVYQDLNSEVASLELTHADNRNLNNFNFAITLSGIQLIDCPMPPLCNHFLQQIGINQQLCQKIFAVTAEMVSNAIDHGVMGLSSDIKESPDGFMAYFQAREERSQQLTEKDYVTVTMEWQPTIEGGQLVVEVEDSGKGYVPTEHAEGKKPHFSGRGSHLIRHLSESVEIFPPGNKIRATIK